MLIFTALGGGERFSGFITGAFFGLGITLVLDLGFFLIELILVSSE
jgi:hypothetical protein